MKTFRLLAIVGLSLALSSHFVMHGGPHSTHGGLQVSLAAALSAQEQLTAQWIDHEGVVGTAVGLSATGEPVVKVYLTAAGVAALPASFAGVNVQLEVSGAFSAGDWGAAAEVEGAVDPKRSFPRPVPIGVSTGHPGVTAGTIGARATDGRQIYALSNNHVFANGNDAAVGDDLLQPGRVDGGRSPDDFIATLSDFEPIRYCAVILCPSNYIDAAVATTTAGDLSQHTPEGGYGTPQSRTVEATLGMKVQKYGRTTGHTTGTVTGINATVDVGYPAGNARFVNQVIISDGSFSTGGDSGSLIVSKGFLLGDRRPVALLFAGSNTNTIANPIDVVLDRFGVTIDGSGM